MTTTTAMSMTDRRDNTQRSLRMPTGATQVEPAYAILIFRLSARPRAKVDALALCRRARATTGWGHHLALYREPVARRSGTRIIAARQLARFSSLAIS